MLLQMSLKTVSPRGKQTICSNKLSRQLFQENDHQERNAFVPFPVTAAQQGSDYTANRAHCDLTCDQTVAAVWSQGSGPKVLFSVAVSWQKWPVKSRIIRVPHEEMQSCFSLCCHSVSIPAFCIESFSWMSEKNFLLWKFVCCSMKRFCNAEWPKERRNILRHCWCALVLWNMYVFRKRSISCSYNDILRKTWKTQKNSQWHNVYFKFCIVMSWYKTGNVSYVI